MLNEKGSIQFNLDIILEALNALASSSTEQLAINEQGLEHIDDVFDPLPLDYLTSLEEKGLVTATFVNKFKELYEEIDQTVGHLSLKEDDAFIEQNNNQLQQWRETAKELLASIKKS